MNGFDENNKYESSYSVPPTAYEPKKKAGKGKKAAALSILIVVCMIMSSIATSLVFTYLFEKGIFISGESEQQASDQGQSENNYGGVNDPISITKDPSSKIELIEGKIGEKNMSVAQVAALVADSVVEITTSSVQYDMFYGQQIASGAGSGVVFGRSTVDKTKYYIVTNHHVIEGVENISVRLRDGSEYECALIGSDVISDIGILEIKSDKELTVAALGNSDNLHVGEEIVVIGNPLGRLGGTVTDGIISALERKVNVEGLDMTLLQHNAAISPGNSGGGIFDTSGYLVGVVNAKSGDSSAEGLGFAIPINYAYNIIEDILNYGYVTGRASLPVSVQEYMSSSMFGSTSTYVVVTSEYGSLKINDIVYSVNYERVADMNGLLNILSGYEVGDKVILQVARTEGRTTKLYSYEIVLVESTLAS